VQTKLHESHTLPYYWPCGVLTDSEPFWAKVSIVHCHTGLWNRW